MKTITRIAGAAAILTAAASTAMAQSPAVPTPTNPAPARPVATDGSPLPYSAVPAEGRVYSGRSVGFGGPLGFAADTAGAVVGTAGAIAGGAVDAADQAVARVRAP